MFVVVIGLLTQLVASEHLEALSQDGAECLQAVGCWFAIDQSSFEQTLSEWCEKPFAALKKMCTKKGKPARVSLFKNGDSYPQGFFK